MNTQAKAPAVSREDVERFVALLPVGSGRIKADALCVALGLTPPGRSSTDNERRVVRALREAAPRELGVMALADEAGYFVATNMEQVDGAHAIRRRMHLTGLENIKAERELAEALFLARERGQLALPIASVNGY